MTDTTPAATAQPGRATLGFIFFVVMLDMIALGIVIPVSPRLIGEFAGDPGVAARYIGWFTAAWALMHFFASPLLGALSDRFGRRPVILISLFGLAADYVVMALAPNLFWLFLGRLVSGVTAATLAAANAYIADITPPDKRASRFGLLSAAFGIGLVLGPALGGLLADMSLRAPFWLAAGLTFANALFGLFVLPESLPKARRSEFNFRMANPLGSIDLYRAHPGLLPLAGVMFLFVMSQNVLASVWVPYVDYRFGWPSRVVGLTLAAVGIATIVVQALVVKRAVGRFGERGAVVIGLLAGAAGLAIYGVANGLVVFLAAIAVFSLSGLINPGAQGMMSRSVSASEQGRLQGANMAVNSLAALISPILFTEIFARSIGPWRGWAPPGLPFYLAACLLIGALLLVAAAARRGRAEP